MKIIYDVYTYDFGIILPKKTGVWWKLQTDGIMCAHPKIQGVFLPLKKPFKVDGKITRNLLNEISNLNYDYAPKSALDAVWKEVNEQLSFEYIKIKEPINQPVNQEGLQWIRIVKIKKSEVEWEETERKQKYADLVGQNVALIYPNSD